MSIRARVRLGWVLLAVVAAVDVAAVVLRVMSDHAPNASLSIVWAMVAFLIGGITGQLVVRRHPGNVAGRVLLGLTVAFTVVVVSESYASYAFSERHGALAGATAAGWVSRWSWIPVFLLAGLLLLVFPDGRPPGARWRMVGWTLSIGAGLLLCTFPFLSGELDEGLVSIPNPLAAPNALAPLVKAAAALGYVVLLTSILAAAISLVARWRRGDPTQRDQMKWVAIAAALIGISFVLNAAATSIPGSHRWVSAFGDVTLVLLFVAIAIAILRHRVIDVDLVVNRALVYALLAAFVAAAYVAIVVGIGRLLDEPSHSTWLSVVATTVVAVAFAPVRQWAQTLANRVVYGETTAPYDVVVDLGRRLASTPSPDELLESLARSAATGVGAATARVDLSLPDGSTREARWPSAAPPVRDDAAVYRALVCSRAGSTNAPRPGGELGQIEVTPRPGVTFSRRQRSLIDDLARQAAPALANLALTTELEAQIARVSQQAGEIRRSRQRIVIAQDAERRRIERDVHDGAQQDLVGIALRLRTLAARASDDLAVVFDDLHDQVTSTLGTLRDLARGVFPPTLAESGLGAALANHIGRTAPAVTLDDRIPSGTRPSPAVENALYFCGLEALQNVAKYAPGANAVIRLGIDDAGGEPWVWLEVRDDGPGFDAAAAGATGTGLIGLADRMAAVDGELIVESVVGRGTVIRGRAPLDGGARTTAPA